MREGLDPKVYCWFVDDRYKDKYGRGLMGHLLFDEVKLKSDMAWNCRTNKVVGFCTHGGKLDLKDQLRSLIQSPDDVHETRRVPAIYANQWRFQSVYNEGCSCKFFFNSGNLDGDELLRETTHVTTCLELVGVKILAYVANAGGANERMYNLLRKGKIVQGGSPDEECALFVNFLDRYRRIACVMCVTHNMKACRNNIIKSKPNGKRGFCRNDKVNFG
jgi:hypothetical protein